MNRRQKIIVSVVGIFIVLLALVGITYGYFLTRIQGNTNTTSIRVTTADLKLVYGDGNAQIITKTEIQPNTVIGTKDFTVTNSGNTATEYAVTIEDIRVTYTTSGTTRDNELYNAGDKTSFVSNDFIYTLTCTSVNTETGIESGTCNGVENATFPMIDSVLVENDIAKGITHKYEITVTYLETGKDQSADMNKTFNAKVNIGETQNTWEEPKTGTLLYVLKNNNEVKDTETIGLSNYIRTDETYQEEEYTISYSEGLIYDNVEAYMPVDITTTSCKVGGQAWITKNESDPTGIVKTCNNETEEVTIVMKKLVKSKDIYESILASAEDDYGTSYYFRGDIENNYVNYSDMCWRIVRVDGRGNIKIILADENGECDADSYTKNSKNGFINNATTYDYGNTVDYEKSNIVGVLNEWASEHLVDQSKLVETEWCNDVSVVSHDDYSIHYGSTARFNDPSWDGTYFEGEPTKPALKCDMVGIEVDGELTKAKKITSKIGILTADEVIYSGMPFIIPGTYVKSFSYLKIDGEGASMHTMTPETVQLSSDRYSMNYLYYNDAILTSLYDGLSTTHGALRPTVVLNSNVRVTTKSDIVEFGEPGTQKNPYVVS